MTLQGMTYGSSCQMLFMSIYRMKFAVCADFVINAQVCFFWFFFIRYFVWNNFSVKGSVAPMSFYTFDVNPYPILPSLPKNGTFWDLFPPTTTAECVHFSSSTSILFMNLPFRYRAKFGTGVQAYLDGQWAESKQILTECQRVLPHDGPTKTLLNTMSKTNFQAPRQWRGYRELTSK